MSNEDTGGNGGFVSPTSIASSAAMIPSEKLQDYERSMALLMNLMHARDRLQSDLNAANERCQRLQGDVIGKDAQIETLKNMLIFAEDQVKAKEAECSNLIATYRNERDATMQDLADTRAKLRSIQDLVK